MSASFREDSILGATVTTINLADFGQTGHESGAISNDHASAIITGVLDGVSFTLQPGEVRKLTGASVNEQLKLTSTVNPTPFRSAWSSSKVPPDIIKAPLGPIVTAAITDGAVTAPKLAAVATAALAVAGDAVAGIIAGNTAVFANKATFAANKLQVGSVIRLRASGKLVTKPGGSAQTEQVEVKIGTTVIGAATAALNGALNDTFWLEADLVIRAVGAGGKFCGMARIIFGSTAPKEAFGVSVDGAIDTTASNDLTISVIFAADATAGDVVDLVSFDCDASNTLS